MANELDLIAGLKALREAQYIPIPGKTTGIDGVRWNESYDYVFEIVQASSVNGRATSTQASQTYLKNFRFNRTSISLNLPPSAISVGLQFTSTVSATNKGILEEHNGVVFRNISISGTTGIFPKKPVSGKAPDLVPGISKFAPSTGAALNKLSSAVKGAIFKAQEKDVIGQTEEELKNTGYYQFWLLHNFFVEYAEAKKRNDGNSIRLVFRSIKDNIAYVVTPSAFELRRDTSNPLLYRYSIGLRAWDILSADTPDEPTTLLSKREDVGKIRGLLDRIRKARQAVQAAKQTIKAVQSDIGEALQVINQGVLVLKDVVSLEADVVDFLPTIVNNLDQMIKNNKAQFAQVVQEHGGNLGPLGKIFVQGESLNQVAGSSIALATGGLINPANPSASALAGLGSVAEDLGVSNLADISPSDAALGIATAPFVGTDVKNLFPSGEKATAENNDALSLQVVSSVIADPVISENIKLSELAPLPSSVISQITEQKQKANETTSTDIYNLAEKMKEINDNLASSMGLMDDTYAEIFNVPKTTQATRSPTEDDIILQAQIEDGRDAFLATLASGDIYKEREIDPFQSANGALQDGQKLLTPSSAIPVTVDRGAKLEDIAAQYLNDPTRAKEIAILNKLRAPYVDEEGFSLPILSPNGRDFIVRDRSKLTMGQVLNIQGTQRAATRRKILNISDLGDGSYRITVDGAPNLQLFDAASSPYFTARLPGTIGTGDTLLIPSQDTPAASTRISPLDEQLTYAERVFKVDIASDDSGDLVVGPGGDFQISYGYQNAIQAIRIKLETEAGELALHPQFGLEVSVGQNITGEILTEIQQKVRSLVTSDARFSNANVTATIDGTALRISVDATGAQGSGRIPVEFISNT